MVKRIFFIIMVTALLFTGCKKGNTETKKDDVSIDSLIEILGGGKPSKTTELIDVGFIDLEKKEYKLSEYKGKVIFLNLWATWCPPCRSEMPSMDKLYNDYKKKDFVIIGVSVGEDLTTVKDFIVKNKYTFPIFIDSKNEVARNYGTGSIPTSYIINKEGIILAQFVGARDWYSEDAVKLIEKLLD